MENKEYVELINDDGKLEKLIIEASFHIDDVQYVILREENSDEGMIYSVLQNNNELVFNIIDDPEELKEVIEIYEGIVDEII